MTAMFNIFDSLIEWYCYFTGEHTKQSRESIVLQRMEMITSNIQYAETYAHMVACEYQLKNLLDCYPEQKDVFYTPLLTAINRKRLEIQKTK